MSNCKLILMLPMAALCLLGCSKNSCLNLSHHQDSAISAKCYAEEEGIEIDSLRVDSIASFGNGKTSVFDSSRKDDYAIRFRRLLENKDYDEVCMRPKQPVLGGDVCLYIEKGSYKLLAIYRGA